MACAVAHRPQVVIDLPLNTRNPHQWIGAPKPFGDLSACSTVLVSHLRVRLGALGLLRRRRLALHCLCASCEEVATSPECTIHSVGRRMFLVGSYASCRLPATNRSGSGTRVFQVCSSAATVTGACHCGANTQEDNGATRKNYSFPVHLLLPCSQRAPRRSRTDGKPIRRPQVPGGRGNLAIV